MTVEWASSSIRQRQSFSFNESHLALIMKGQNPSLSMVSFHYIILFYFLSMSFPSTISGLYMADLAPGIWPISWPISPLLPEVKRRNQPTSVEFSNGTSGVGKEGVAELGPL